MVQIIGVMVGCYIATRSMEMAGRKGNDGLIKLMAFVTFVTATLGTIGLFFSGKSPM